MIYHFILNPMSGKNYKKARKSVKAITENIRTACQNRNLSYRIYYTTSVGDATEYVRSMVKTTTEAQRFICVGGDGTINELANSVQYDPNVEFGVIPFGSGNDFVRNFTNTDRFSSIDAQLDGEPMAIDLIKCNSLYCANMANIGFDCTVVKEAAKLKKLKLVTPGMSYIMGVFTAFFKKFGTQMKIIFDDGEVIDSELMLTAIGNGRYCGGGFCTAPKAFLDDGIMDIVIIRKLSRLSFIGLVGSYKKGTFLSKPKAMKFISYKQASHFKMEFEEPLSICLDGEIKSAKTIDFSVVRNGFNFVIPKGCEIRYTANK